MKKQNLILSTILTLFAIISFSGCSERDIKIQRQECLSQNKNFIIKKVLNMRTGEYILKGECK